MAPNTSYHTIDAFTSADVESFNTASGNKLVQVSITAMGVIPRAGKNELELTALAKLFTANLPQR
jgi:hypothetical protein